MTHDELMYITEEMPRKVILIEGRQYLERYFVRIVSENVHEWLHRFLIADSERHLHTHAWSARSEVLTGRYTEETPAGLNYLTPGSINFIGQDHLHRIVDVEPNTWTRMLVDYSGWRPTWKFIGDDGQEVVMQSDGPDWHRRYMPRRYGINTRIGA